jgi:PBP1b-binding outer membrane lipoprotein LpoB
MGTTWTTLIAITVTALIFAGCTTQRAQPDPKADASAKRRGKWLAGAVQRP